MNEPWETIELRTNIMLMEDYDHVENPREYENLGTMVTWHRKYYLGDIKKPEPLGSMLHNWLDMQSLEACDQYGYYTQAWEDFVYDLDNDDREAIKKAFKLLRKAGWIFLDIYGYEHDQMVLSTSPFSCPFDSGWLGLIYIQREVWQDTFGWKNLTVKRRKRLEEILTQEVKTYSSYIAGNVYEFNIRAHCFPSDPTNAPEVYHLDNCDGCIGFDLAEAEAESLKEFYQNLLDNGKLNLDSYDPVTYNEW